MTRRMQAPPDRVSWGGHELRGVCRAFATASFKPLPREKWKPVSNRKLVWHIFDQLDGHCMANAAVQTVMMAREKAGLPRVALSPEQLYCQHSNWGTGSTAEENLRYLRDVGVCPYDGKTQAWWNNPRNWPANWKSIAAGYRILEWEDLGGDFDLTATAVQKGWPVVIGVTWPGGGGHGVAVSDLTQDSSSRWCLGGPNSWSEWWNGDGFYSLTESQCRSMSRYGSWCCRQATFT